MTPEQAENVANALTSGQWTHDYPITADLAKQLGLKVSTDLPKEVYLLMDLYPQAIQRRPSVEYLPVPHKREKRK